MTVTESSSTSDPTPVDGVVVATVDGDETVAAMSSIDITNKARELRNALEHLFHTMSLAMTTPEEKEVRFLMLVSEYPQIIFQKAVLMTETLETVSSSTSAGGGTEDGDDDGDGTSNVAVAAAVVTQNSSVDDNSEMGHRLPIHLACDKNAPISIIKYLLDADIHKQSILVPDKWNDLPIHTACSRNDVQVIKLLLESDTTKTTIRRKDYHGYTPIHMACRYKASPNVMKVLLENDTSPNKQSLFDVGIHGQLPIHVACRNGAAYDVIKILLDFDVDKKTIIQEDEVGRLPIHVYLLRSEDSNVVRLLLEGMICDRMQRVGLLNWKVEIDTIIKSLTSSYERDFMTREKLDFIVTVLEELKERAVILELAVWKASCIIAAAASSTTTTADNGDTVTTTTTTTGGLTMGTVNLSDIIHDSQYKKDCRIKSGAEMIIPGILPYLDDEPIEKILLELKTGFK